ncbi:MAG: hypothetical protein JNK64_31580 [Myxococcales bacterium]|nr:hypothetical protein [Myxococcales bacterium]
MSYRDDVDALFHRARTLQAEVDRLRGELAARDAPPAPPAIARMEPPPLFTEPAAEPMRRVHDRQVLADDIVSNLERAQARAAWLPPVALDEVAGDDVGAELGLLVARCSEVERVLLMRLLELITADDFAPAAVARHQRAFDQLAAELRARLAGPA